MKDFILKNAVATFVVASLLALVTILEAAGIIEWIDEDTYVVAGYCDNSGRNQASGIKGGGSGIDSVTAAGMMAEAKLVIEKNAVKINYEYFLSKRALDSLFKDLRASGIFIAPYFDKDDTIRLIVGKSHCNRTMTDPQNGFAFAIKTFCPIYCEMQ